MVLYVSQSKRKEWEFSWILLVCLKWAFWKHLGVYFVVVSNYINPEDNYGPLIDFLSQTSKLSYFKVLDLADFMMYQ